jgi:hypothetical protein
MALLVYGSVNFTNFDNECLSVFIFYRHESDPIVSFLKNPMKE